jgi:hypothetical protein
LTFKDIIGSKLRTFFVGAFESAPPAAESKLARAADGLGFGISLRASSPSMYHVLHNFPTDLSDIVLDDWGAMASSSRPTSRSPDPWRTSHTSQISRTLSPQPRRSIASSTLAPAFSPASSARSTPVSSPRPLPNTADNTPPVSMAGMSKEEKAAEMARRKEERRLVRVSFLVWRCGGLCLLTCAADREAERTEKERCYCWKGLSMMALVDTCVYAIARYSAE